MDTDTPTHNELTSAESLPAFEATQTNEQVVSTPIKTTTSTEVGGYEKEIVVRGTGTVSVTLKVNVEAEASIQKNFIANRGPAASETASGHEG